jgi:hypothetical protein
MVDFKILYFSWLKNKIIEIKAETIYTDPLSKWSFLTCSGRVQQLSENNFQRKIAEIS